METLLQEPETERNKSELGTPKVSVMDSDAMAEILFKNKQLHKANLENDRNHQALQAQ